MSERPDDRAEVNTWLRGAMADSGIKPPQALNQGNRDHVAYQQYHEIKTMMAAGQITREDAEARIRGLVGAYEELKQEAQAGRLQL